MSLTETVQLPQLSQQHQLNPAPVYDVAQLSDERTRTLKQLLDKGHVTVAPLRDPQLILHSHLPHVGDHALQRQLVQSPLTPVS